MRTPFFFTGLRPWDQFFKSTAAIALSVLGAASTIAAEGSSPPTHEEPDTPALEDSAAAQVGTLEATTPPEEATTSEDRPSLYDTIWGYTRLYHNEENRVIQQLDFVGRFQVDYARVDAAQGSYDEWNVRRLRLGAKARFFRDFIAHVEVDLDPQEGQTYQSLTDAYIAWVPSEACELTLGKQGAGFTMDGQTSSKRLLSLERNNLSNNIWFTEEYAPGFTVTGEPGRWVYQAGLFSSSVSDSEFGNISGGAFALATAGYNFNEALGVKEALLRLNYVYNAPEDPDDSFANRPLEQIGSINFSLETDAWGVRTDLGGALGYGSASDVWGAMVMPWYNLSDHLQVVTRYTFVRSIDENGVRLNRYENQRVSGRGDEYQEFYIGLNWYLYGHKLKLQTGVDYAYMADRANDGGAYDGWGWTTGLRISW